MTGCVFRISFKGSGLVLGLPIWGILYNMLLYSIPGQKGGGGNVNSIKQDTRELPFYYCITDLISCIGFVNGTFFFFFFKDGESQYISHIFCFGIINIVT